MSVLTNNLCDHSNSMDKEIDQILEELSWEALIDMLSHEERDSE